MFLLNTLSLLIFLLICLFLIMNNFYVQEAALLNQRRLASLHKEHFNPLVEPARPGPVTGGRKTGPM
jgi:hypothetical protein